MYDNITFIFRKQLYRRKYSTLTQPQYHKTDSSITQVHYFLCMEIPTSTFLPHTELEVEHL